MTSGRMAVVRTTFIVLAGWCIAPAARATVLLPTDVRELSREAVAVARGRVATVETQWTDGRRSIETLVTLEAETYLKGDLGRLVRFRVPGGSLGRFRSVVVGAPQFSVGQRVIVFLGSRGPSIPYVLGLAQGVFRLQVTIDGDWLVTPPMMPGVDGPVVRGTLRPTALADFERQVHVLAGAP
jgi:hypothetical protein